MSKKDIFSAIFEADLDEVRKRIKPTVFKKKGQLNKTNKNGDTPLHFSLYHPIRESVVRLLIQAEADVNAKNNFQSTSLHFACLHKASVEIVKLLLSKGADVSLKDQNGNTPLHLAVSYYPIFTKNTINFDPAKLKLTTTPITKEFYTFPSIDLIQSLLDSGAEIDAKNNDNRTPLHFACLQKMNYSFIEFLLKSKANPNIPDTHLSTPFHSAIQMANQDIIDLFLQFGADPNLKDVNDNTPLHLACSGELSKETIEKVLKLTKDINSKNSNQEAPIHILCKNSSATPEIVSLFATYKADFNAKNNYKETPLHIAAKLQSTKSKIFEVLIENGAKVDEKNNYEQTPLHVACLCSATTKEALKIIIDQKKDMINAKDMKKSTPLHFACKFKLPLELIKILLEYGADINSKNDDDKIPMDVASPEIKEFLSQIQQNPSKKPEIIKQNENIQEKKDEPKKIEAKKPIKNIIQEIEPSDSETSSTDDELGTVVLTKRDTVKEESIIQKQDDPNSVLDYPIMKIDKEIEFEQLDFVKFIARGSFKEVFKGLWLGLEVALMKLLCSGNLSESELREFKSELSLLSQLAHPNIVQFYGACTKEPNLCIVTEFCHGGTLLDYLQSDAEITRKHQYEIALDIVRGIYYLHANKIVHRDLKTPNILLDRHGDAKIADFGLSKTVNAARTHLNTLVGTFNWMAPEVMYGQNYSFPADIYALAIILWEISTRKIPFEGISAANLTKMIAIEKKRLPLPQDGIFNSLIEKCWDQDPNKRPTIKEVLMKLQRIKV